MKVQDQLLAAFFLTGSDFLPTEDHRNGRDIAPSRAVTGLK